LVAPLALGGVPSHAARSSQQPSPAQKEAELRKLNDRIEKVRKSVNSDMEKRDKLSVELREAELGVASARANDLRARLVADGVEARSAVFTSIAPGVDMARLAREHDVDLLLVDAPDGLLEDARVLALLDHAPCDVGVVVGDEPAGSGPVLVPFAGAEHVWAAVELGAWLARARGVALQLAGATAGVDGRDASRLLASASIAVQRALGVATEPVLIEPDPEALVDVAAGAGTIVVGLTDRWRREGLGRARTALATQTTTPAVLVRRGVRPGGLAPRGTETRFTWTIAG
jgi:hypothetical protein